MDTCRASCSAELVRSHFPGHLQRHKHSVCLPLQRLPRAQVYQAMLGRLLAPAVGPAALSKPLAARTVREGAWAL